MAAALMALVLAGFSPLGVNDVSAGGAPGPGSFIATLAVNFCFVLIALFKGKVRLSMIGTFVPFVALFGAIRLARPGSPWARRFYRHRPRASARAGLRAYRHDRRWSRPRRAFRTGSAARPTGFRCAGPDPPAAAPLAPRAPGEPAEHGHRDERRDVLLAREVVLQDHLDGHRPATTAPAVSTPGSASTRTPRGATTAAEGPVSTIAAAEAGSPRTLSGPMRDGDARVQGAGQRRRVGDEQRPAPADADLRDAEDEQDLGERAPDRQVEGRARRARRGCAGARATAGTRPSPTR